MKLNQIISESIDAKRPTDLTKYPLKPGNKYPANFYTGKKGVKQDKIVLGYNNVRGKFITTDPVASISQNNSSKPDNWLVQTLRGGVPYFYLMNMPVATMKATCGWYLKGKNIPLVLQSQDGIFTDYMNLLTFSRNERGELKQEWNTANNTNYPWAYYDGTKIQIAKRPAKPRTSVEAYNYLMYWAYSNSQPKDDDKAAHYAKLANYLETEKRLKQGIKDVIAKYPKAKDAVIAKLKEKAKEEKQFELNLEPDGEAPAEQQAAPAPPEATTAPVQQATPDAAAQAEDPKRNWELFSDEELNNMTDEELLELGTDRSGQVTPEADQTTSNAAAETTNTRSYNREFGGMPDNRGAKPTRSAKPPPADDGESEDDEHDRRYDGYQSRWAFEALDHLGVEVKDSVDAATEEEAIAKIRQMGYHVTKITDRAKSRPQRSFWQRFVDGRSVRALRKRFLPGNDE
jgi:hypothetical protein